MWREFLLEGLKKFAGEIIGVLLLVAFLYFFPNLRSLFTDYTLPGKEEQTEIQKELELHKQEEERLRAELKRREDAQTEAERKKVEEVRPVAEKPKSIPTPKRPAMNDYDFLELCKFGDTQIVAAAIDNGANVNAKGRYDGFTALMWAAFLGRTEIAELLLEHGANVNAMTSNGETALMQAASFGHTQTVELLLKHGADVNAISWYNTTALMQAEERGYSETANLLRKYGAISLRSW